MRRIRRKVTAQLLDHVLIILIAAVTFDVEVPAVNKRRAERAWHGTAVAVAPCIPQILADGLRLRLGLQRVRADGAAEGHDDLDAVVFAGLHGGGEGVAVLRLAGRGDVAGLADGAGGNVVALKDLVSRISR